MDRTPYNIFFIFSQFRTGSGMFAHALDSHPEIACPHESLMPQGPCMFAQWEDIAEQIYQQNPQVKFIGLHGHYPWLNDDMHLAKVPKIHLMMKDTVKGAVAQCLFRTERVDRGFPLDVDIALDCNELRIKRDREMAVYSTLRVSYEKLTRNRWIQKLPRRQSRRVLRHIGVEDWRRVLTVPSKPPTVCTVYPNNLKEIYARARCC